MLTNVSTVIKKMDFKQLKKQSSLGSLTEKLLKEAEKMGSSSSEKDSRIFSVDRDKSGLGMAVIRFMPPPEGEDSAFVKLYNHGFQANGKWLIENCPTTVGQQCVICTSNSVLWNSGVDSNKKIASARKRKLNFYSNVYVVKNPANPELEGKVMLFRYGKKIFDKIMSAMKPEFEDDTPIDPFDLWTGADFKIRIKTVRESSGAQYPNYDDSIFLSPRPLNDDDEELEAIWKQCHSLQELISNDKFKSEEELQKRLNFVLGTPTPTPVQEQEEAAERQFSATGELDVMKDLEASFNRSKDQLEEDDETDDSLSRFQELVG
jgi:hypothetical protein